MTIALEESAHYGAAETCNALGISRSTFYRKRKALADPTPMTQKARRTHPRRLSEKEQQAVIEILTSERFMDKSVREVYATLLDEGVYYCSIRTMYRILQKHSPVKERRNQLTHPSYTKPELLATGPNEVWSWDITKLKASGTWSHYYLYVILDLYSRYVVGWIVAERESSFLAERLIDQTCSKQAIKRDQLTIHADRGTSMRSKTVAQLLADLGVTRTHSRPYVSDDNPYSETQFKTLKYHYSFPGRFGSLEDARNYLRLFFDWYNNDHRHSGIGLMAPVDVHTGRSNEIIRKRQETLAEAYTRHPERFVKGIPSPPQLPKEVWINKPEVA